MAFDADPEEDIRQLNQRRNELERELSQYEEGTQQQRQHYAQSQRVAQFIKQTHSSSQFIIGRNIN